MFAMAELDEQTQSITLDEPSLRIAQNLLTKYLLQLKILIKKKCNNFLDEQNAKKALELAYPLF